MWCVRKPICPMNWVHASVYVLFLLFPWDPTRLTCSTMCQDPPRHVWICGEFPRDFLPVFARFFPRVGLFLAWICWISCGCRDVVGGLVTAWLIPSVTDSHGKRKMETDQRGEVWRSQVCQGGEARLRRMFTIFILNNRVLGSWDKTQSRLWTITQPLLWSEITKDRGNTGISGTIVLKFTYTMKLKHP